MKVVVKPPTLDLNMVTPYLSDMLIATRLLQVYPNFHGTQKFITVSTSIFHCLL